MRGGKETLSFSEVLATAQGTDTNVGDMSGHGIAMGKTNGFSKMFEEHGWVYTLMSARPKTVYANALPKKFTRETCMDYWVVDANGNVAFCCVWTSDK